MSIIMDEASFEVPSESSVLYKTTLFPQPQTTTQKTWLYTSTETGGRKPLLAATFMLHTELVGLTHCWAAASSQICKN